jgi:hypothetical protein
MPVVISKAEALSLGDALGSILGAVIDAQAQSARATVDFINDVAFVPVAAGQPERLRTVKFQYTKLDENGRPADFTVELPLLSLVDIPLVSVKKATISFVYEITQASAAASEPAPARPLGSLLRPATLKGRVVDSKPETRERANLQVSIELEKSELPPGLDRVLDILQVAMNATKTPT